MALFLRLVCYAVVMRGLVFVAAAACHATASTPPATEPMPLPGESSGGAAADEPNFRLDPVEHPGRLMEDQIDAVLQYAQPDIMAWKYRKLMMNLGNAAQAACRPGPDKDRLDDLVRAEGEHVFAAAGLQVVSEEEDLARRADHLDTTRMRARGGGSTWQSLRRGTGDVEVDYLNGEISLLGRLHGVPTPANDLLRDTVWRLAAAGAEPASVPAADLLKELDR